MEIKVGITENSDKQDWLRNLWGPSQNENAVSLFKNHYQEFQDSESRALNYVQGSLMCESLCYDTLYTP